MTNTNFFHRATAAILALAMTTSMLAGYFTVPMQTASVLVA